MKLLLILITKGVSLITSCYVSSKSLKILSYLDKIKENTIIIWKRNKIGEEYNDPLKVKNYVLLLQKNKKKNFIEKRT